MPATRDSYERELARSVDAVGDDMDVCPDCDGTGATWLHLYDNTICPHCNGTGHVEFDAMDDGDKAYERAGDR